MRAFPIQELPFLSVVAARKAIECREVSPLDLVQAVMERIERHDGIINSFIVVRECALAEAEAATAAIREGRRLGPLHGIPVALKDLFETEERPTTFGSPHFQSHAGSDATVVRRLKEAGAIIVGYNNLDEFALGSFNANEHYGQVRNPWDLNRTTGGSSGGSAAAVAAGFAQAAIGTDTGISVRQPSAFCNLVGLKPSYGLVDAQGAMPLSFSLDHIGPITRTIGDGALLLSVLAGGIGTGSYAPLSHLKGIRLGVPDEYFFDFCEPEVERIVRLAISLLKDLGATLSVFRFGQWNELNKVSATICRAEAGAFHRKDFLRRPETFGASMRDFLSEALAISAADYLDAQRRRAEITASYEQAASGLDAVVVPTSPQVPALIEEGPELHQGLRWRYTGPFTALGVPALSVPSGFAYGRLPVGVQFAGRRLKDTALLNIAVAYETATEWHLKRCPALDQLSSR